MMAYTDARPVHGVAVVGLGRAGNIHINNLTSSLRFRVKLLYLVDPIEAAREEFRTRYHLDDSVKLIGYDRYHEVLNDKR